jgi:tRNA A37 N6-isopentenylltransferase MiaA
MAYVTRLMRRKMADDAHEARHPERAQERLAYRKAAEQALSETMAKFAPLTAENFEAANNYREQRTQELLKETS